MKLEKSVAREKKSRKRRYGQRVSGKSVFLIQSILIKKGNPHA